MKPSRERIIADAERYRFLRAGGGKPEPFDTVRHIDVSVCDWGGKLVAIGKTNLGRWSSLRVTGRNLDREIDRLMKRQKRRHVGTPPA